MHPVELIVVGVPVSLQSKGKGRAAWKARVANEAHKIALVGVHPHTGPIRVCITYYYEGSSPDVDNIIKPIQDALCGIVYVDDAQVEDTRCRKKRIDGSYTLEDVTPATLAAIRGGRSFVRILISEI